MASLWDYGPDFQTFRVGFAAARCQELFKNVYGIMAFLNRPGSEHKKTNRFTELWRLRARVGVGDGDIWRTSSGIAKNATEGLQDYGAHLLLWISWMELRPPPEGGCRVPP